MKYMPKTLLFTIAGLLFSGAVSAGEAGTLSGNENPLLEMVGRPYAEYHDTYKQVVSGLLHIDSLSRVRLAALFREAAAADRSGEWKLMSDMVAITVRFYESRKGGYTWSDDYTAEEFSEEMLAIARRAGKQGFPLLEIFGLHQAGEGYRVFVQDYEQAFACYLEAAARLETITTKEFPPRPHIYIHLANLYYTFREYDDAIRYFEKVAADPDVPGNYYGSLNPAVNGIALSYRNGYADYDRSDSCFMHLLDITRDYEPDRVVWEGITEANIGYNYYLRRQPDVALKWLVPAIAKVTRPNDFEFVTHRATDVAGIYLEKGDRRSAKRYIDMALDYHTRTRIPEKNSRLYEVLARYHAVTGNNKAAAAYLDSTLMARDRESAAFSGLVLRRIEQKLRESDRKLYEQKLQTEKIHVRYFRGFSIAATAGLVLISLLLAFIGTLYHKKRQAYRQLVIRAEKWAKSAELETFSGNDPQPSKCNGKAAPSPVDRELVARLHELMNREQLYKDWSLTLENVAEKMDVNRNVLSKAINGVSGKNFNRFVNDYRIREAIRIISSRKPSEIYINELYEEIGFNSRTPFYLAFKQVTGLSTTEYIKSKKEL